MHEIKTLIFKDPQGFGEPNHALESYGGRFVEDNGPSNFVQRKYNSSLEDPVQVAEVVDSALKFQVYTLNM